jgi:uncharacterized protein (TIGR03118 family)
LWNKTSLWVSEKLRGGDPASTSAHLRLRQLEFEPTGGTNMINLVSRRVGPATVIAIAVIAAPAVSADDRNHDSDDNRYVVTNLVSDIAALKGQNIDPVLQNAWGVAFTPGASPFWVADNATGCSTLYDGTGVPQPPANPSATPPVVPLQVRIPLPGPPPLGNIPATACKHNDPKNPSNPTPAAPTGMVWNPTTSTTTGFLVPGTSLPASFIWATEDGTISAWTGGLSPNPNNARLATDNSAVPNAANGAVYKGLVFGTNSNGVFLFATDFRGGKIASFAPNGSTGFRPTTSKEVSGSFTDPDIPAVFAPFGIQNINGNLFVTYALQNQQKHDDVAGPGNGFVDIYDTDGNLLQRFASRRPLNSPWGVTRASFAFGRFSGDILVGDFGDGKIHAFDSDGNFRGTLRDKNGKPIVIDGLWTLTLGGGRNSNSETLYFTAGPNGETDGLFGTITPVADNDDK